MGDAVLPDRRHPGRHVDDPVPGHRRVGGVRAGRRRPPDLDRLLVRQRRRGAGAGARRPAGDPADRVPDPGPEHAYALRRARARPAGSCSRPPPAR